MLHPDFPIPAASSNGENVLSVGILLAQIQDKAILIPDLTPDLLI
jgi:hypothetical protein